jgi:hypothetical protein
MNVYPTGLPQTNNRDCERTASAGATTAIRSRRSGTSVLFTLPELAAESSVSRRFLEMEITRGRLVAVRMSTRVLRVRSMDWDHYLNDCATRGPAVATRRPRIPQSLEGGAS